MGFRDLKSGSVTRGRPRSYVGHVEIRAFRRLIWRSESREYPRETIRRGSARARTRGEKRQLSSPNPRTPTHTLCLASFRSRPVRPAFVSPTSPGKFRCRSADISWDNRLDLSELIRENGVTWYYIRADQILDNERTPTDVYASNRLSYRSPRVVSFSESRVSSSLRLFPFNQDLRR